MMPDMRQGMTKDGRREVQEFKVAKKKKKDKVLKDITKGQDEINLEKGDSLPKTQSFTWSVMKTNCRMRKTF